MKRLGKYLLVGCISLLVPNLVNAATVTVCNTDCDYKTIKDAVTGVGTTETTISVKEDITISTNETLKSNITLDIPTDVTLTLESDIVAQAGAKVKNNGLVVVKNGTLDISALGYGADTGLISNQSGKISVKSSGVVKMLNVWAGAWTPKADSKIFESCENGAVVSIKGENFTYLNNAWQEAIKIGDTGYTTLAKAVEAAKETDTIKLYADIELVDTQKINKKITIDLNGHTISRVNSVFEVQGGDLTLTGEGSVVETAPDYAPVIVRGSNKSTDTNYTTVTIGEDVELVGWSGVFIRPYTDSGNPYGYGITVNVDGKIIARKDTSNVTGHGVYINGLIKHTTNYPIINIGDTVVIDSVGTGVYVAGYAEVNIGAAKITGVETGIGIKAGIINLDGTIVTGTDKFSVPVGFSNGINASGAAIQIESNTDYAGQIELNIKDGKYTSTNGPVIYEYIGKGSSTAVKSISILDGTYTSGAEKDVFMVSSELFKNGTEYVSGGTYSTSPLTYLKTGYKAIANSDETYTVSKSTTVSGENSISGVITNGEEITVQLKQGGSVLKTITTDESGNYSFSDIGDGTYNVVFVNGIVSTMKTVIVDGKDIELDITMPTSGSVELKVYGSDTPSVVVDGLEDLSENGEDVLFSVDLKENDSNDAAQKAILEEADASKALFIDLKLEIDGSEVSEPSNIIHIVLPFDLKGKENIGLYRYHNNTVDTFKALEKLPTSDAEDKTYYVDTENNLIHIYTAKFSTYGVTYKEEVTANPQTFDGFMNYLILGGVSLVSIVGLAIYLKKNKVKV